MPPNSELRRAGNRICSPPTARHTRLFFAFTRFIGSIGAPTQSAAGGTQPEPRGLFSRRTDAVQGPARPLLRAIPRSSGRQGARAPPKGTCREMHEHTSPSSTPAAKISPNPRELPSSPKRGSHSNTPTPAARSPQGVSAKALKTPVPTSFQIRRPEEGSPAGTHSLPRSLCTHAPRETPTCNDPSEHCLPAICTRLPPLDQEEKDVFLKMKEKKKKSFIQSPTAHARRAGLGPLGLETFRGDLPWKAASFGRKKKSDSYRSLAASVAGPLHPRRSPSSSPSPFESALKPPLRTVCDQTED